MTNGFLDRALVHFPTSLVDCSMLGPCLRISGKGRLKVQEGQEGLGVASGGRTVFPKNERSGPDFLTLNLMIRVVSPQPTLAAGVEGRNGGSKEWKFQK
jgi:hypothetical protein